MLVVLFNAVKVESVPLNSGGFLLTLSRPFHQRGHTV